MISKRSIFEYDNYRTFLKDYYSASKAADDKFSLGYFSRLAGFKSRSVLRQVIAGERNIAAKSIEKFTKGLKLNKEESLFFRNLVAFNQSQSPSQRDILAKQLLKSRNYKKLNPLKESQYNYLAQWYFVVIREMANLPGFKSDPAWIASHISPPISTVEASKAVDELLALGFLTRTNHGQLVPHQGWISTGDEVTSAAAINYHDEMLKRARESIERVPRGKRDISAQTFAVSTTTALQIKEKIQKFRKEIEDLVSQDENRNSVYQLNFQLFPIGGQEDK